MKRFRPWWLAVIGVAAYISALAWVALYHYIASRYDPPGWIVDRATPDGPKFLAILGACCVAGSLIWGFIRLVRNRLSAHGRS